MNELDAHGFNADWSALDDYSSCDHLVAAGPVPQLEPVADHGAAPKKVLVLEDDELQLHLLRQHLAAIGLQCRAATSVQQAWQFLREEPADLAIFDIHLPDGCGLELCRQIDDDPRLSGLPVVVLSSSTQTDIVRRTRAAGAYYFISKPYDPNVLLAIIERALASDI
jgi:DNA-binding response OmpR family regulator